MINAAKLISRAKRLAAVAAALALMASLTPLHAQNPPTDRDLRVYAGLHAAAAAGDVAEIEKLAAEGENLNIQDSNSRTPLIVATFRKQQEAARTLIRLGANPNARDLQGFDMLTIATAQNDIDMVKIALEGGANARAVTGNYDGTALISAAHLGHAEIVKLLIAANAPLDHVNRLGWTALIQAVVLGNGSKNHIDTVEALVAAGADVDIKDRQGMTALDHARARNYQDMVNILVPKSGRKT
jgi:ankyrin repeat protein